MAGTRDIGRVEAVFRYPVKSMAGEALASADVGFHGVDGDRRYAFRRVGELAAMPWLTASRLPELLRFVPRLPTHVRTPEGAELPLGDELDAEISRRWGRAAQLIRFDRGIFDDGAISIITPATIDGIGAACGMALDVRRFRPNLVLRTDEPRIFEEDAWIGGVLSFGDGDDGPQLHVTLRDERCAMLNLDPDSAQSAPQVMKAVVKLNDNNAGVYAAVTRVGRVAVGQRVRLTI